MQITYYALRAFDEYVPGDLIPGAAQWPYINMEVESGKVAPVLVATLPASMKDKLSAWEKAQASKEAKDQAAADKRVADAAAEAGTPDPETPAADEDGASVESGYDPSDHKVEDVLAYVEENPDEREAVLAMEVKGKARVTITQALEVFDPGDYSVEDVLAYVKENPDEKADVLAREIEGGNRVTLVKALTAGDDADATK